MALPDGSVERFERLFRKETLVWAPGGRFAMSMRDSKHIAIAIVLGPPGVEMDARRQCHKPVCLGLDFAFS